MTHRSFAGAALLAGAAALVSGCGDNEGNPVGYGPEADVGAPILVLAAAPDSTQASGMRLNATIFSPPPVNGFRLYLDPADQGYRPAGGGLLAPAVPFGSGWSVYTAPVDGYDPSVATHFVARGAKDGVESLAAPLTNTAFLPATNASWLLTLSPMTTLTPPDSSNATTQPTFSWTPVPGATRYLLQVFSIGGFVGFAQVYGAITTTPTHTYGVDGVIFEQQPLRNGGFYVWSVQAIDGGSRVFAASFQPTAFFIPQPPPPP
jgi:hypothetical protein